MKKPVIVKREARLAYIEQIMLKKITASEAAKGFFFPLLGIKSFGFSRYFFSQYGLIPRASKKYTHFVNSISNPCLAPNILSQNFYVNALNCVWISDFTYIKTYDEFKYLAVAIDLFSRRIIGWNSSDSMSYPGNPYDNAVAESFFHSLKVECLYDKKFYCISDLYSSVLEYIKVLYNRQRLHSYLGYLSPVSFENLIS